MRAVAWGFLSTARINQHVLTGARASSGVEWSAFGFPLDDLENVRMRPELDGGSLMGVGC